MSYIIATEDVIFFHISSNVSSTATVGNRSMALALMIFALSTCLQDSKRFGECIRQAMEDMRALFEDESHAAGDSTGKKNSASAS